MSVQPCNAEQHCPAGLQCLDNACCRFAAPTTTTMRPTLPPATAPAAPTIPDSYLYPWLRPQYTPTPYIVAKPVSVQEPTTAAPVPAPQPRPAPVAPPQPIAPPAKVPQCQNCCPGVQVAVCFCSQYMNACPQKTVCSNGSCCAASKFNWDGSILGKNFIGFENPSALKSP